MKQSLQFWLLALVNSLYSLVTISSVQAQIISNSVSLSGALIPPGASSAVKSSARTRKFIPAWLEFSERWMFVDISTLLTRSCSEFLEPNKSQFIITGRGGLPPNPREALALELPWQDFGLPMPRQENRALINIPSDGALEKAPIQTVEAQGWVIGENAGVVLTANPTTAVPKVPWLTSANCHMFKGSS